MNYISTSLMLVANKLCSLPDSNETGIILAGPPSMAILLGLLVVFRNGSHLEQEVLSVPSTTHTPSYSPNSKSCWKSQAFTHILPCHLLFCAVSDRAAEESGTSARKSTRETNLHRGSC